MTKQEELARIICGAVTGLDPDTKFCHGEALRASGVYGFVVPNDEYVRSLWSEFSYAARRAIEAGFDRPELAALAQPDGEAVETPQPNIGDHRQNGETGVVEVYLESGWVEQIPATPTDWRDRMGLA